MRIRAAAAGSAPALQLVLAVSVALLCVCGGASAQRVFISEYYHSSSARAIEIFNPSCWNVSATGYSIRIATNGGSWGVTSYAFTGAMGPRAARVMCNPTQTGIAPASCHVSPTGFTFTGNDAVGLFHNGVLIDAVGAALSYVTAGWDIAGVSNATVGKTVRRLRSVLQGNPTAFSIPTRVNNSYLTEWSVQTLTAADIGWHNASVVPTTCPTSLAVTRYFVRDLDCGSTGLEVMTSGFLGAGASLQIRCPTTCASEASAVASTAVTGSGYGPYTATSLVCLSAIISGLTPLKGSNRAPISPSAAQQATLCASGAYQVETAATLYYTALSSATAPFTATTTGTCFNSSASATAQAAFRLGPRDNTTCYNDCNKANGGGTCNITTGICQCSGAPQLNVNPLSSQPFFGDDCSLRNCTLRCYNGGTCNLNTGACTCPGGYSGAQCLTDALCSRFSNCTGNGVCVDGICRCNYPYYGAACQFRECPNACSDGGRCNPFTGTCACDSMRLGADCSLKQCPGSCFAQFGVCDLTTGTCVCDATANALNVGRGVCSLGVCPNSCSGHGTCNYSQRICTCSAGWLGPDCSRAASA